MGVKMAPVLAGVHLGLLAITVATLGLIGWMSLAPLHGAVVAVGLVKPEGSRKFVQHTDGGIVKRVLVRNGDRVDAGQALIEFDDVRVDASVSLLQEMQVFETLRRMRLDAEQQLAAEFRLENDSWGDVDSNLLDKAYQREVSIFRARRGMLDEHLASYQRQLRAIVEEQAALRHQRDASQVALRLANDELKLNEALVQDRFISRVRLIALERSVAEHGAKQGEHEAMLAQSEQRRNDVMLRMAAMRSDYQRAAAEEFKDAHARLVQLREQLRPAEDANRRKVVVAPAPGTVVNLRLSAPGEVAPPREPLMEIVPDDEALIVEAKVGVDAIKHLVQGQATDIRFTTFNSRTTPMVKGQLMYVAADALVGNDGIPYYVIHVRPQVDSLVSARISSLRPGMAAEIYVLTEPRSVFNYLLVPVTDVLKRTLREP